MYYRNATNGDDADDINACADGTSKHADVHQYSGK